MLMIVRPAQGRDLLDVALHDLGEAVADAQDARDLRPVEVVDRRAASDASRCRPPLGLQHHLVGPVASRRDGRRRARTARSAGSCRRSRGGSAAPGGRGRPARRAAPAAGARSRRPRRSPRGWCGRCSSTSSTRITARSETSKSSTVSPTTGRAPRRASSADVVAVERDVHGAEGGRRAGELADQGGEPGGERTPRGCGCRPARAAPGRRGARRSRGRCARPCGGPGPRRPGPCRPRRLVRGCGQARRGRCGRSIVTPSRPLGTGLKVDRRHRSRWLRRRVGAARGARPRPRAGCTIGSPRSGNGTSIWSKSRGTRTGAKTASASARTSRGANRLDRWVSTSRPTSASRARTAASRAVVWRVSRARSRSSSRKVASCTSTAAPRDELEGPLAGLGVAGDHHGPSRPGRPEHLVRAHQPALGGGDLAPALEHAELRALRHAERAGGLEVERPRPVVLDERVADRRHRVAGREGARPRSPPRSTPPTPRARRPPAARG